MSGSGGGGYGDYSEPEVSCELLTIETQLSSPKPDVVAELEVGSVLQVELEQQGPTTVVVLKHTGNIAGGIASPRMPRLRECIQSGTRYMATVVSIVSDVVRVRITPVR